MQQAVLKLKQLGFSEYEAKAYMALVNENPLTAYELSKNSGIPSSKIYEVLNKLELRHIVQSVRGERSKMFIPISPDEFIETFKTTVESNLHAVKSELSSGQSDLGTAYIWHVKNYETLIHRARRMITTARDSVLLLLWKEEMHELSEDLQKAAEKGIKIAAIHYGHTDVKLHQLYMHPAADTIYAEKNFRGFILVADSREAVNGTIDSKGTDAMWSMNAAFVTIAEDYIRHDIYLMKTVQRFAPQLRKKFGDNYEKLRDVFTDEAF